MHHHPVGATITKGTPPFTFTYQRASLETSSKGAPRILETHTVSGVMGHEYSIFSALEGVSSRAFSLVSSSLNISSVKTLD